MLILVGQKRGLCSEVMPEKVTCGINVCIHASELKNAFIHIVNYDLPDSVEPIFVKSSDELTATLFSFMQD